MKSIFRISEVSLTNDLAGNLREITAPYSNEKIFLIFDTLTYQFCWPLVVGFREIPRKNFLIIDPGEDHKNISQVMNIWREFGERGCDRHSLIINIGGGMVTDLGSFAACTLKRGVKFINVPTTLLAMVDASVGGKSGINFRGLKNEVGIIQKAEHVFLYLPFLKTLPVAEILSGFAEMLKAGLIADKTLWDNLKDENPEELVMNGLEDLLWRSVEIKNDIVQSDPFESGQRKALNFGHTIGHAVESESLAKGNPIPHGFAVAYGMILEAHLSHHLVGLSTADVAEIDRYVRRLYGKLPAVTLETDRLLQWMKFDKKNQGKAINFTLLPEIGQCKVDNLVQTDQLVDLYDSIRKFL